MPKRGNVVSVPPDWLDRCRRWRKEAGITIDETGPLLARAIQRGRPFSEATVRRYLRGALVTDELTRAFAKAMGVPAPVILGDEKQQAWHDLGVRLAGADQRVFDSELGRLQQLVQMAEELKALKPDE